MNSRFKGYLLAFFVFLIGGIVALYFAYKPASPEKVALEVTFRLDKQLSALDKEALAILEEWRNESRKSLPHYDDFSFFVVASNRVMQWSDNAFVPSPASLQGEFEIRLLKQGSSNFVARKWKIDETQWLVGVIFLSRKFTITNDYLKEQWNRSIFPAENIHVLDPEITVGIPVCWKGHCPFRISFDPATIRTHDAAKALAVIFIFAAICIL